MAGNSQIGRVPPKIVGENDKRVTAIDAITASMIAFDTKSGSSEAQL